VETDREVIEMMFWYGAHWAFWQVSLMWVGMIVFWGLLIWAVYALITAARKPTRDRDEAQGHGPRRILDERLARGEIDEAEYRRLRELLASGGPHERADAGTSR
jgi:putative membrane protein